MAASWAGDLFRWAMDYLAFYGLLDGFHRKVAFSILALKKQPADSSGHRFISVTNLVPLLPYAACLGMQLATLSSDFEVRIDDVVHELADGDEGSILDPFHSSRIQIY